MKSFLVAIFVCASLLVCAQKRPNIFIILSDDHAYQAISAYGNKLGSTPNIDRIAKEGAIFKKGLCHEFDLRPQPRRNTDRKVQSQKRF